MVFIKVKIHTFHMVGSLRFNMTEVQRAFLSGIKQTFFFNPNLSLWWLFIFSFCCLTAVYLGL